MKMLVEGEIGLGLGRGRVREGRDEAMEKEESQALQCPTPSTTFVQADPDTFRELVQRLTGASQSQQSSPTAQATSNEAEALTLSASSSFSSSSSDAAAVKRSSSSTFKLYERRQGPRPKLQIVKPGSLFKPSAAHPVRSPFPSKPALQPSDSSPTTTSSARTTSSMVTSPSGSFSNLSICSPSLDLNREEEERAIKERRFFLHPSPRSRPGGNSAAAAADPELLPLFPLSSPKTHDHSS